MSDYRIVYNGAKMAELLRGPQGPVWRHLETRAVRFQLAAVAQAPLRTGCLRRGIKKRPIIAEGDKLNLRVVSETFNCEGNEKRVEYSLYVHEGTKSPIVPVHAQALAFYWPNGPQGPKIYFFKKVKGHPPNRYLSDHLHIFTD